jgi:CheY-like chemotaxis protein
MPDSAQKSVILLADDDPDDRAMTRKALEKNRLADDFYTVADGVELMDFLHHRGRYAPPALSPVPGLILLDLNMPKKDGREALAEIKSDSALRRIPVVVITTSQSEEDVLRAYDLGGNSFISKPITLPGLVEATLVLGQYWFQVVTLPEAATS